jgi:hypothetical protein
MTSSSLSDPIEIAEVDRFWIGSGISAARRRAGGDNLAPMQPFGEPHEREREGRGEAHEGYRRGDPLQRNSLNPRVSISPPSRASLYRGGGELTSHQVIGRRQRGGPGAPRARAALAVLPLGPPLGPPQTLGTPSTLSNKGRAARAYWAPLREGPNKVATYIK